MAREFSKKFYESQAWIRCRNAYRQSKFGLCEQCGQPGVEVHHKIWLMPDNINNPDITLNWDNLILLCRKCHAEIHMTTPATRSDVMFDDHGNLIKR
jgi:5-methylcytosine-specific restriction endonuclease McrA